MATLVLTALGTAIGGPIGGAIGALIGQTVDQEILFRPPGREGPRLKELEVQTSRYGAHVPLLFGRMRAAGQVVWSTDLKETRTTEGGGKGQPSLTSYSYSASFAVLLSARPIVSIGRIWADGNLLRGAEGDFKTLLGAFRVHEGGEMQVADPLIAAAEGGDAAPALRGCGYVVFEDLQLADFGNRIPSLTFEVIADDEAVAMGDIVARVAAGRVVCGGGPSVLGYAAHGDSLRAAVEPLMMLEPLSYRATAEGLVAIAGKDGSPVELVGEGAFADGEARAPRIDRELAPIETTPRRVTVMHYDPARDYQTGAQHALRDGAGRIERKIELPATLDAAVARGAAERALARQLAERARLRVTLPWQDEAPPVGAQVTVAGEAGVWRVTGWQLERMVTTLELVRTAVTAPPALAATPGRAAREEDVAAGPTLLAIAEMPLGPELASAPRLGIAAGGGAGWRGAVLSLSSDGGASWRALGRVRAGATMGSVETVPVAASAALVDRRSTMVVRLSDATRDLANADAAAIDAGANLALAGDELIQFELAVPLGGGRWRLSGLHRGRRATEAAIGAHVAGEPFVLVEPGALVAVDVAASAIGGAAVVLATGAGDAEAVEAEATLDGRSLLPPAPAHLRAAVESGGVRLSWFRRSRIGWGWHDGVDAPLGEESERYRITIARGDGVVRQVEVETPSWLYAADELAADMLAGPVSARVRQCGTHGLSRPAVLSL